MANGALRRSGLSRVAYFTTDYPSVSHTFIRREILGLERLGHQILRIALRPGGAIVEPSDESERQKTYYLLHQSKLNLLKHLTTGLALANLNALRGLWAALKLSSKSERGLLRHMAYLLEAFMLISVCKGNRVKHVHVHFGTNVAAVALLARIMDGPTYSMTIHGPDEFDSL